MDGRTDRQRDKCIRTDGDTVGQISDGLGYMDARTNEGTDRWIKPFVMNELGQP
jgi:hypothetical protein